MIQSYYTALIFLSIMAMIVIQLGINESHSLTQGRKKLFHILFTTIIIAAFCEWFGNYLQGSGPSTRLLHIVVKAVELSLAPSIAFYIARIIERRNGKLIYLYLGLHALVECASGVFGFIYYVDANSNYIHAQFYWIYMAAYVISIFYCVYIVFKNLKKYQYNGMVGFAGIVIFMLTGILIQMADSEMRVVYITLAVASSMLYIFTLEMINQTDELTELINRRGFENYTSHLEHKCVILFFDVDHFKEINDTYGHAYGDKVLRVLGRIVKNHYVKYGKCFRYGGDEFCVILIKNTDKIDQINEELLKDVEEQRKIDTVLPTVSIGYSYYDPENQSIQEAMEKADQMMYERKKQQK